MILAPEQYQAHLGYRLLDPDEKGTPFYNICMVPIEILTTEGCWSVPGCEGANPNAEYRTTLTRAELRAKRGLPSESPKLVWIRSTDRMPQKSDLPILCRRCHESHIGVWSDSVPVGIYVWQSISLPAEPEQTQDEKDAAARTEYLLSFMGYATPFQAASNGFDAGVKYGRANP